MLLEFASASAGAPPRPRPLPTARLASRPEPARLDKTRLDGTRLGGTRLGGTRLGGTRLGGTRLDIAWPAPAAAAGVALAGTRAAAKRLGWLQGLAAARTANPPMAVLSASLRGPLIPIIGFAQLMRKDLPARHRSQGYAAEIESAATGLLAMLDALLAQATGRPLPPETEPQAVETAGDTLWALQALLESAPDR